MEIGNNRKVHNHLRRLAVQMAAQLPETTREALIVIDLQRKLVLDFFDKPEEAAEPEEFVSSSNVMAFSASRNSR